MGALDNELIETLLHMAEGASLDFKQCQYPLAGATDEQKGELVKDILAFANGWKTSDAFILVGVAEQPGMRALVVGVSAHHDDAVLQQLVNSKTNVPVNFEYIPTTIDGKSVGVIRIAQYQHRPIFLKKPFGRLGRNEVPIRRGSSTAVADPDEIAKMGAAAVSVAQQPAISFEFGDPRTRKSRGASFIVRSRVLVPRPPQDPELERLAKRIMGKSALLAIVTPAVVPRIFDHGPTQAQMDDYRVECALLTELGFVVHNTGRVLVEDARVVLVIPKLEGLRLLDEFPDEPVGPLAIPSRYSTTSDTNIHDRGEHWELVARIGKVQPSASVWSDPFWIGSPTARALSLEAVLYADNVSPPVRLTVGVQVEIEDSWLEEEEDSSRDEE